MKDPDEQPNDLKEQIARALLREMHAEAQTKPTPLHFPAEVGAAVLAYVKERSLNINHLIPIAVAAQYPRYAEFIEIAKFLHVAPDSFEWPLEDPLRCVALAFGETMFDRLREHGFTSDWDDFAPADWWKADE